MGQHTCPCLAAGGGELNRAGQPGGSYSGLALLPRLQGSVYLSWFTLCRKDGCRSGGHGLVQVASRQILFLVPRHRVTVCVSARARYPLVEWTRLSSRYMAEP